MSSPDELDKPNDPPKKPHFLASVGNVTMFFAISIGIPFERIAKMIGLNPATLMDPDAHVSQEFFPRLLLLIAETFPEKNMSLELARTVPLAFLGSPWRLLRLAPDLRTCLNLFVQNHDLLSDQLEVELFRVNEEVIFKMYHPLDENDNGAGAEVGIGIAARIARELFSDSALARIQFRHAARSPISPYETYFKVPVTFHAEFNALVFHHKALDRQNKSGRTEIRESLEWRLARLRQELGLADIDELADIREAITHNAQKGDYSAFKLAERMAMSPCSLQRRIHKSGTNATALLNEARYTRALELLANEHISIKEIASQLGFSSESAFHKAFQRWSQKTPVQVRREIK
ncbi:MAG TPA: AraC family transcriptional regulator [Thiotrichaceae bacterium]|nr:AraC family transcriptional regulator [Thiotrichaceae bacterium]